MKRYLIEREVPGIGRLRGDQLKDAARTSNLAVARLAPRVQWEHSYVAGDRTFCIFLADDEAALHEHARSSGFPATRITEIATMIDPTTAN